MYSTHNVAAMSNVKIARFEMGGYSTAAHISCISKKNNNYFFLMKLFLKWALRHSITNKVNAGGGILNE